MVDLDDMKIDINSDFGNIVLYEGNSLDSKVIRYFTRNPVTHAALQINKKFAIGYAKTGRLRHNLITPEDYYDSYYIIEHLGMDKMYRKLIRKENRLTPMRFSRMTLVRNAIYDKTGKRIKSNNSTNFTCSSRIAYMYDRVGLPVVDGFHYSEIQPHDFLRSKHFKVVDIWRKNDSKNRSNRNRTSKLILKR